MKMFFDLEARIAARLADDIVKIPLPAGMLLECERGHFALGMPHTGELYFLTEENLTEIIGKKSFACVEEQARADLA